ncbi:MAG: hypothetical protein ISR99_00450 [Parcubacteria group bacterium]|nr:hypothetical protein [Parcubacteria group bacterium]
MPHVSSKKIDKKTLEKMHDLFFSTITSKRVPRKNQQKFFEELLTETEKVMLAKRLTAIALLSRGVSPYQVGKRIKLSETTTNKLQIKLEEGKFSHIIKTHLAQSKSAIGHYLENLISPPPKYGKGLMKHLEDTY